MMYTYECAYEDCPEIATIKEWRLNYYFYKCSECALNSTTFGTAKKPSNLSGAF